MVERQKTGFGQPGAHPGQQRFQEVLRKNNLARPAAQAQRPLPGSAAARPSPHVIHREGETERPAFHGSYIEKHWPKLGAAVAALFALGYLLYDGKRDPFGLILAPVLFGGPSFLAMNGLRKSLNNVHAVRTKMFTSPTFGAGAFIGLCYFVYSTLFGGPSESDSEIAKAVAEFQNPLTQFKDGFQQKDFGALAILILKLAGTMALGGLIVNVVAGRLFGVGENRGRA